MRYEFERIWKLRMNPISNTAFYCCGVRMEDAKRKNPVCNDRFAKRFMDERGMEIFTPFKSEIMPNISNITRCRIIDDTIRDEINKDENINVITIGAGFDTRAYRMAGGNWIELDESQIMSYKNEKLPIEECRNPLRRIAIDFSRESLIDKLKNLRNEHPVVIIIEGVFMYLEVESITKTLQEIQSLFPKHDLVCDLMTRKFFDKYAQSIHSKIESTGAKFAKRPDSPENIFKNNNYVQIECISTLRRAIELGIIKELLKIPDFVSRILLDVFMKDLNGYAVHHFQY